MPREATGSTGHMSQGTTQEQQRGRQGLHIYREFHLFDITSRPSKALSTAGCPLRAPRRCRGFPLASGLFLRDTAVSCSPCQRLPGSAGQRG